MNSKEKQAAILTIVCVLIILTLLFGIWFSRLFSPPPDGSGVMDSQSVRPALIMSCADLQRELNRMDPKLKLVIDGVCGPATMAAWNAACNMQYALELWPVEAK